MKTLLPCPFCGLTQSTVLQCAFGSHVECRCGGRGPASFHGDHHCRDRQAVELWNRRTEPTQTEIPTHIGKRITVDKWGDSNHPGQSGFVDDETEQLP